MRALPSMVVTPDGMFVDGPWPVDTLFCPAEGDEGCFCWRVVEVVTSGHLPRARIRRIGTRGMSLERGNEDGPIPGWIGRTRLRVEGRHMLREDAEAVARFLRVPLQYVEQEDREDVEGVDRMTFHAIHLEPDGAQIINGWYQNGTIINGTHIVVGGRTDRDGRFFSVVVEVSR